MSDNEKWMSLALKEAKKAAAKDEVPIGAVIVKDGVVIARAHNQKERTKIATHHAELLAIEKACKKLGDWRLTGCCLYVTIEPCAMCTGAIIQARLSEVVYGGVDTKFGAIESVSQLFDCPGWNHYPKITSGIMADECSQIISEFFKKKRGKVV